MCNRPKDSERRLSNHRDFILFASARCLGIIDSEILLYFLFSSSIIDDEKVCRGLWTWTSGGGAAAGIRQQPPPAATGAVLAFQFRHESQ